MIGTLMDILHNTLHAGLRPVTKRYMLIKRQYEYVMLNKNGIFCHQIFYRVKCLVHPILCKDEC
jgi:hypothetical protein